MHRSALVLLASLLGVATARAADDPRALIERARRATGDSSWLKSSGAIFVRARGTLQVKTGGATVGVSIFATTHTQLGHRARIELEADVLGNKQHILQIFDGKKGWLRAPATAGVVEIPEKELAERRASELHDRIIDLKGILEDRRFTLTALGESKVQGKTVLGVKVSCKDHDDTFLYFDRATGLLARATYRTKIPGMDKPTNIDCLYLDYRAVDTGAEELSILKKAGLDATGPALIAFLRKQTPPRDAFEKAKKLVKKLGDDAFRVREQASKDLVGLGVAAIPALEEASRSADAEVRRRARTGLKRIKEHADEAVTIAAVHLLALRRPDGAAKALLDLLPRAPASVAHEVRAALYHLGAGGGKPDLVLVAALKDPDAARRAAAAAALGKDGGAYARLPNRRIFRPGLRIPHKTIAHIGEDRQLELEVREQRFYNRFDDSLFAPPAPK